MGTLETLRSAIPDHARDLKLNLQNVLQGGALTAAQRYGVAIASAAAARSPSLTQALVAEAHAQAEPGVAEDALAAASLMAMNNIYYRFRHMVGKAEYSDLPARLRMTRLARPATNKLDFELFALAVSAINGCATCVQAHEQVVIAGGLSSEQVNDAVRIAATVNGVACALESDVAERSAEGLQQSEATAQAASA